MSPPAERADQLLFTFFHLYGTPAPGRKRRVGRLVEDVAQLTGETKSEGVRRALVETAIVLHARLGAEAPGVLGRALDELEIQEIPFGEVHWREAADAYRRFGKGRHEAHLSFGDCMTYATARLAGEPLLSVGDDFGRTDLDVA